ncbi:zinc ribbon domain-containing protein [bacterium]|nr:zinc ribbon domain-containing protein [bacterium]
MLECDKCGASITDGAKFCAQCGDPVTEADKAIERNDMPQIPNGKIYFGLSSSSNYTRALEICKNIPSFETEGEGKSIRHVISLPITEVELIVTIFDLVGTWKSSKMLINNRSASKKELTYYGVGCYRNRIKAYKPKQYCFGESDYDANIWGCKRMNMPIYEWGGGWLEYGELDNAGIWYFDKGKIKHELEIALNENELCPVLNRNRIMETLAKIPETISPKSDPNWEYKTEYKEVGREYKEVAVGIKPVVKKTNSYVVGDFIPEWKFDGESSRSERAQVIRIEAKQSKKQAQSGCAVIVATILGSMICLCLSFYM